MAKKRKDTPRASTLHNFFASQGTASAAKRPKLSSITPRRTVAVKKTSPAPEDIIVIDDSDDDHAVETPSRPARAAPKHSVSNARTSRAASGSGRGLPLRYTQESDSDVEVLESPIHKVAKDTMSFGTPTLLIDRESITSGPAHEDMDFGRAVLLLQSGDGADTNSSVSTGAVGLKASCPSSAVSNTPRETIEDPVEEWGTGDDEMDATNGESAFVTEPVAGPSNIIAARVENTERCPICDKELVGMNALNINEHVNDCIDGISSAQPLPIQPEIQPIQTNEVPQKAPPSKGPGAFSVLMTSHKENEAWREAADAEDRNFRPTKANGGRRKAPFYKVLQGMPIAVDAFRYGSIPGVTAYFLTHAHSDHYTNLSANWKNGPIYCSEGTANLIMLMLGVDQKWVHPLPMNVATVVPDTGGVQVTLIEANHCPGSCLFLFEGQQTVNAGDSAYKSPFVGSKKAFRYLHCGDFRASPQHVNHPSIKGKHIDHVYLDTTYLDPKYCFPPQSQVISACAELARRLVSGEAIPGAGEKREGKVDGWFSKVDKFKQEEEVKSAAKTLVVVGTYSIGKERIVKAIAKALKTKVYSDARKTAILRCQSDPELDALLTSDPLEAGVHLLPLGTISSDKLKIYLERWKGHYAKAIGFRPTGWTFSAPSGSETLPAISTVISRSQSKSFTYTNLNPMKNSTAALQMYGVPYSEHSSFFELTCFALSLDWGRMIATVNVGSETSRGKMSKWVERWEAEQKKRGRVEIVPPRDPDYW